MYITKMFLVHKDGSISEVREYGTSTFKFIKHETIESALIALRRESWSPIYKEL